ncbi:hypothetical protein [Actinoplanes subtropicus]|uniref:hypothetical protein n=1 Tax=Actinoplanes subtropicus TaxID=543632 RepID=UPI0006917601|nr:hypothetical protein [Actinoplanes subtropicus]
MSDGFRVDLGPLENAAAGVNETLADLKAARVDGIDGEPGAYGHGHLADVVKDFCDRWEIGIEHLATDGHLGGRRCSVGDGGWPHGNLCGQLNPRREKFMVDAARCALSTGRRK